MLDNYNSLETTKVKDKWQISEVGVCVGLDMPIIGPTD